MRDKRCSPFIFGQEAITSTQAGGDAPRILLKHYRLGLRLAHATEARYRGSLLAEHHTDPLQAVKLAKILKNNPYIF